VWKTSAAPQLVQRVCLFCCSPIESSTKQFVKRHEAFGWISKKFGGLQASKILCSGLICSSAVEAALMILIVVWLAKPRRRANVLPLRQRSSANEDRDRVDRAA